MRKPRIVAELSCNHQGDLGTALRLIERCAAAGADALKIQVWDPNSMVLDEGHILLDGPWAGKNLHHLYQQAQTPWHWLPMLFQQAKHHHIPLFASVFDPYALAELEKLNCPEYKIASFELVDLPLIESVAKTKKPLTMSTGMATQDEIREAVTVARLAGCQNLTLLKCTSAYPADPESAGLLDMERIQKKYDTYVGLSDHTQGIGTAVAAAVLGASMIEKHVTLEKQGFDAQFSITTDQLKLMVDTITEATQAVTFPPYPPGQDPTEEPQRKLRRSLYWKQDVKQGQTITLEHLTTARPALGRPPNEITEILGRTATYNHTANSPVGSI